MTTDLDESLKKLSKANPTVFRIAFEHIIISPEEKKINGKLNSKSNNQIQKYKNEKKYSEKKIKKSIKFKIN